MTNITTNHVGESLSIPRQVSHTLVDPYKTLQRIANRVLCVTSSLLRIRNQVILSQYDNNIALFTENILRKQMNILQQTSLFPYQFKEETTAKSLIMPFLQLTLLTNTAIMQMKDGDEELRTTLGSEHWDELDHCYWHLQTKTCIYLPHVK